MTSIASANDPQEIVQPGDQAELNITPDAVAVSIEAKVRGERVNELPQDLYIPPDALEVFLDAFEGPLDLLLYLIRKQNLDILDIPVAQITAQYMEYIGLMQSLRLELAAEYLVMAALLAEIKSRMLLPKTDEGIEDEDDPRATLVQRLQDYARFKQAAEQLDAAPRVGRDVWPASARPDKVESEAPLPQPSLRALLTALADVLSRAELFASHAVAREPLSVRERMSRVLEHLQGRKPVAFAVLIDPAEGKLGVVVCFLAVLELIKGAIVAVDGGTDGVMPVVRLAGPVDGHGEEPLDEIGESEYD